MLAQNLQVICQRFEVGLWLILHLLGAAIRAIRAENRVVLIELGGSDVVVRCKKRTVAARWSFSVDIAILRYAVCLSRARYGDANAVVRVGLEHESASERKIAS